MNRGLTYERLGNVQAALTDFRMSQSLRAPTWWESQAVEIAGSVCINEQANTGTGVGANECSRWLRLP